jgi:parallel beta-helix repeat protein
MKTIVSGFILILSVIYPALAANHYIRQGATGNGSDWNNAYGQLPAALTRGDTYYIGAGNYEAYTFDDALSGTKVITIKKATVTDHGTNTGWQAAYGNGQAVFNSVLWFAPGGYYVFDGQTRNENDWFDGSSYGFKVYHNNQDKNIVLGKNSFSRDNSTDNITIKYVYIEAIYLNLPSTGVGRNAVDTKLYEGNAVNTGLVFSRMYIYGACNQWMLRNTNGAIVEYSAAYGNSSNSANHGESVNLYYSGDDAIIRYNQFNKGLGTALVAITEADGCQFYGNVCWDYQVGDGAVGFAGGNASNCRVYNNTFVNGKAGIFSSNGSNNLVYNNLWHSTKNTWIGGTHDYNAFSGTNNFGESHAQINVSTSIFVNYAADDFRLASPTTAGNSLPAPYNTDMFGNVRGEDGVWDRGAFEYSTTNVERRTLNVEFRIPSIPSHFYNIPFYTILGRVIHNPNQTCTGVYFIIPDKNPHLQKAILVK